MKLFENNNNDRYHAHDHGHGHYNTKTTLWQQPLTLCEMFVELTILIEKQLVKLKLEEDNHSKAKKARAKRSASPLFQPLGDGAAPPCHLTGRPLAAAAVAASSAAETRRTGCARAPSRSILSPLRPRTERRPRTLRRRPSPR